MLAPRDRVVASHHLLNLETLSVVVPGDRGKVRCVDPLTGEALVRFDRQDWVLDADDAATLVVQSRPSLFTRSIAIVALVTAFMLTISGGLIQGALPLHPGIASAAATSSSAPVCPSTNKSSPPY